LFLRVNRKKSEIYDFGRIMQDVPSDLFISDILCYISPAELLPLSFTCKQWSTNVNDRLYRDHIVARHLIFPCESMKVTDWWSEEIRPPCVEEFKKGLMKHKEFQKAAEMISKVGPQILRNDRNLF
jgi:hypothetical protein